MDSLWSVLVGIIFAAAFFLLMRPNLIKNVMGVIILSHGVNLLIFTSGGIRRGAPAIIEKQKTILEGGPDSLVQALILTAIVIGFGMFAFLIALLKRYLESRPDETTAPEAARKEGKGSYE